MARQKGTGLDVAMDAVFKTLMKADKGKVRDVELSYEDGAEYDTPLHTISITVRWSD